MLSTLPASGRTLFTSDKQLCPKTAFVRLGETEILHAAHSFGLFPDRSLHFSFFHFFIHGLAPQYTHKFQYLTNITVSTTTTWDRSILERK